MEEFLFKAINKYFKTISITGNMDKQAKNKLTMITFANSFITVFKPLINKQDIEKLNKYIDCLAKNNCLFDKNVPYINITDNIITIETGVPITNIEGVDLVSQERKTKKFTDFVVKTEIQADQYVVGYDVSDDTEVAVNVNDLGVFWDVDI